MACVHIENLGGLSDELALIGLQIAHLNAINKVPAHRGNLTDGVYATPK